MIMRYTPRLFRFFIVFILVLMTVLLNKITTISFNNIELPKNKPEYNIKNSEIKIYNQEGWLLYSIHSKDGWQYPNTESFFLQNLDAIIYESHSLGVKYHLICQLAWINYNHHLINLVKNAHLIIYDTKNSQTHIYGDNITVDIDAENIYSNSDVKIVQHDDSISARGFEFNNKTNKIILKSNVKIIYQR
jgi:LPS export ABC transporter protein LptC